MGEQACRGANISSVLRGCNGDGAKYACKNAGAGEGFIGEVIDSCIGKRSCQDTARDYGSINSITSSCKMELLVAKTLHIMVLLTRFHRHAMHFSPVKELGRMEDTLNSLLIAATLIMLVVSEIHSANVIIIDQYISSHLMSLFFSSLYSRLSRRG